MVVPGGPTPNDALAEAAGNYEGPKFDGTHIISPSADGSNPWEEGIKLAREYDNEMCDMLKDELENLLLFAALFSAIITAFTVVSYTWLQANNTNNPSPVSHPVAVQINSLWFTSLAASLSVSSIGILCMQWVRQYRRWKTRTDKRTAALRRQRYEGFLHWHVPNIIAALPVILQIALVLFGGGLMRLLWSLNHTVAICFTVVASLSFAFIVGTTLAPGIQWLLRKISPRLWWTSQCPYQSPQAWLTYKFIVWALTFSKWGSDPNWEEFDRSWLASSAKSWIRNERSTGDEDTSTYETQLLLQELIWLDHEFGDNVTGIKARARALRQLPLNTAREVVATLFQSFHLHSDDVSNLNLVPEEKERNFKHLKVWYLWAHAQIHSSLDDAYMKARIDFMSEVPTKKIDLPGLPRAQHLDVQCLVKDPFLVPRFLHCLKVMVREKRLSDRTSKEMWNIVGDLLEYSIRHDYVAYMPALGSLFKAMHTYFKQAATPSRPAESTNPVPPPTRPSSPSGSFHSPRHTIDHMLSGLRFFFALHYDQKIGHLTATSSRHMESMRGLIAFLDESAEWAINTVSPPASPIDGRGPSSISGPSRPADVIIDFNSDPASVTEQDQKDKWLILVQVLMKWSLPKDRPEPESGRDAINSVGGSGPGQSGHNGIGSISPIGGGENGHDASSPVN